MSEEIAVKHIRAVVRKLAGKGLRDDAIVQSAIEIAPSKYTKSASVD